VKRIAFGSGDPDVLLLVSLLPDDRNCQKLVVPGLFLWMQNFPEKFGLKP
jgi:hypothetical protein